MSDAATGTGLAGSIMAAVTEAREHGVADDQIIDALADAIKGLLERAGTVRRRHLDSLPLRRNITPARRLPAAPPAAAARGD